MPKFCLNDTGAQNAYDALDTFTKGYVEAMFFTNGDTGDEREFYLNELGVGKLTNEAVADIRADCQAFQRAASTELAEAYTRDGYGDEQAGHDFWFTRQGHGVGFWERKPLTAEGLGDALSKHAKAAGEAYVETYRGWIYHR